MPAFDDVMARLEADPSVLAVVLTGSSARGMATERSDHDVIVVVPEYSAAHPRTTHHSPEVDEIIYSLGELGEPQEQWMRWMFRGAKILLDGPPWDAGTFPDRLAADPISVWLDLEPLAREHGLGDLLDEWDDRELEVIREQAQAAARP